MTSPRSLSACMRLSVCLCLCDPEAHSHHPLPFTCSHRAYQTRCPSAEEVREVVLTHLREKEILDRSLPSSTIIGPFYINVDNVKQSLSKKRKALATSMLDILAKNLHKEVDNVRAPQPGPRACSSTHTLTCTGPPTARWPQAGSGDLQLSRPMGGAGSHSALTLQGLPHMGYPRDGGRPPPSLDLWRPRNPSQRTP